ncbi:MAG TPA: hypothetical protein VIF35_23975 [Streptosporangiaceae bacterium]
MRIFFVSDIHGSVKYLRKLVNAGKFYGADVLIMGRGGAPPPRPLPLTPPLAADGARFR